MTYASKLLDKVFVDADADLILGVAMPKPRVSAKTVNSTARDNFADVHRFFKAHGRLPQNTDDDLVEQAVWSKLQGIINKPFLIAHVRELDDCGALTLALSEQHSGQTPPNHIAGCETASCDHLQTPLQLHEIAKTVQRMLHASIQELNQIDVWLSNLIAEQSFDSLSNEQLKLQLLTLAAGIHTAAEITIDNTEHNTVLCDTDSLESVLPGAQRPDTVQPTIHLEPEPLLLPCSIDDVFADEDVDALLGPDNSESAILGGRRAVKVFDRADTEQTSREPCNDFGRYKQLFDTYKAALDDGRLVVSSTTGETLHAGDIFLWDGLIAILTDQIIEGDVAEHSGERRQVIFSNGTEAWLREGSIKRCMYAYGDRGNKIVCKRLVPVTESVFDNTGSAGESPDENTVTGHIYVARTLSNDPAIAKIRKTAVKIGVTKNPVHLRVANAENDSTFLFAKVDIIQTFTLYNLEPRKIEEVLHAFFSGARLKIRAKDRFGKDVMATEWFLLQPKIITQAVKLLLSNSLHEYRFSARDGKIARKA